MKLELSKNHNPNYVASIRKIGEVYDINGADNIKRTVVDGVDMVIDKDMKSGDIVLYFPVECELSHKFLSMNNLYDLSNVSLNNDVEAKCGFFTKQRRVKGMKLRGCWSMGFICPVKCLSIAYGEDMDDMIESMVGVSFDTVKTQRGDDLLCKKYIPAINKTKKMGGGDVKTRNKRVFDKMVDGEFYFHYDTSKFESDFMNGCIGVDDNVSISVKVHGTSIVLSNILCNKKLPWYKKVLQEMGINIKDKEYNIIYSSKSVIRNRYDDGERDETVWGDVARVMGKYIDKDMTIYGEVIGYIKGTDTYIQKGFDYGCEVGQWKVMPYRITYAKRDKRGNHMGYEEKNVGYVKWWTEAMIDRYPELSEYLMPINLLYVGSLSSLYPDIPTKNEDEWREKVLERLKTEKKFLMEKREPMCKNKVPREGIVIRIFNDIIPRAWKLKTKSFYSIEKEQHDCNNVDIEEIA